ncbi:PAS domain-containing sensor histidine kinase [Aridibaculum aurantiacum]|uniref:PAS domain-containing sensor histidine kinase n=1 Tax=Aridibaculum aurantiacum TaxID=2810307 RepID=UPI001A96004F|nr:ATP-binding protein [Aridibaculum aurantiacum]
MSVTNSSPGLYKYQHLPSFAQFILDGHLYQYSVQQLAYARQYDVPLLKFLSHYSDEELIEITITGITEILNYLAANNAAEFISISTERWLSNQLEIVGKYDITAEDLTLVPHVRGKSFKHYAFKFYNDPTQIEALLAEIDDFLMATTTTSANTYITIIKDQLHEQEEFRVKLSNALPGFIYVYDVHQEKQTFSNDKLGDLLGYSNEEVASISDNFYRSVIHPVDWEKAFTCRQSHSFVDGSICSFECRMRDTNGNYKWIRFYETSLRTETNGDIREIIGVAFDVTVEKETSEALATREDQLLEAQSIAQIGSFEWFIDGNKSTTNSPEIYKVFEMNELEKFEEFMQHVHRDDYKMVEDAINLSFQTGNYDCIFRYLRNCKEKVIWSRGLVTIEDGKPVKMIGTVQDITTIKRIEEELKQKTLELEKSNESLQKFAAITSHDLKEPLRKIGIFASKILKAEKDKLTEASHTSLQKIFQSIAHMQQMMEDILQFSFIDIHQEKTPTDLENVLSEVKEILSESIADKNAEITSDGLPIANVIAPQVSQLFQNLIANALKFSKPDEPPRITITHSFIVDKPAASTTRQFLEISIADNGIGFDDSDSEKIFGLFFRLHNKNQYEGSGLGLSICKKIVENHSGTITAKSTIGEGSKFIIQLPL